jgi:hypothetical protein
MELYLLVIKLDNNGVHSNIIENCHRLQLLVQNKRKKNHFYMHLLKDWEQAVKLKFP